MIVVISEQTIDRNFLEFYLSDKNRVFVENNVHFITETEKSGII